MVKLKLLLLLTIATIFTLFTWLGGGIVMQWLSPWSVWSALFAAEVLLILPEETRTESLFDARRRVWYSIVRDPLFWCSLGLITFLVLQWLNACTFVEWNPTIKQWQVVSPAFEWLQHPDTAKLLANPPPRAMSNISSLSLPPRFTWLPWSLRSDEAWEVLNWFPAILVSLLAVRHGMLMRSKRYLLAFTCMMTSILSIAGIIQYLTDGEFLYWNIKPSAFFFATFGYPNHAASFFPAVMALSAGMLLWTLEYHEHTKQKPYLYAISFILSATGGILSESRAGVIFTLFVALFTFLLILFRYFSSWSTRAKFAVPGLFIILTLIVGGTIGFRYYAMQTNLDKRNALRTAKTIEAKQQANSMREFAPMPAIDPILSEISSTEWSEFLKDPVRGRSGYQGILATRMRQDHPFFGSGARSFRWLNIKYIDRENPEEQPWLGSRQGIGQGNVHNDTLQFLAEHGWIGFGLIVACLMSIYIPFIIALLRSPSAYLTDTQADRCWVNRINVLMIFTFLATTLMIVHSFFDLIFRSPACIMLLGLMLVCSSGFVLTQKKGAPHA